MPTDPFIPVPDVRIDLKGAISPMQHLVCPQCGQRIRQGRYMALRRFVHSPAYHQPGSHVDVEDVDGSWHRVTRAIIEETYEDAGEDMAAVVELCAFGFLTAVEAAALIGVNADTISTRLRTFWELVTIAAPEVEA